MATFFYIPEVGERIEIERSYVGNTESISVKVYRCNGAQVRGAAMSVRRDDEGESQWLARVCGLVAQDINEREADEVVVRGVAS